MTRLPLSLDPDALRSFVTGVECGSFALAATKLCRSTSAVSAQLKKLESQCGTTLLVKKGRHLALTASGEILLSYARRLLALNDEAQRAVKGELLQGEIRIGMQEDFGEALMPGILGPFSRQHPGVKITARVDRNPALLRAIEEQALDMALLWQPEQHASGGQLLGTWPLEWIGHQSIDIAPALKRGEPLPLVMFDAPCVMRARATESLDRAGIPWRMVFISHSLSGIWAAVQAGLGITVRTRVGMPSELVPLNGMLPSPGQLGVSLLGAAGEATEAQRLLQTLMTEAVANVTLRQAHAAG